LIDATHPEETRVVVLKQSRVEEFDYESAARKLLRGNIYLAKVTRVEPSLQAAFVDYGGNRHGFLAFNEIHPDYYQIPIADRRALIEAEAAAEAEEEEAAERAAEAAARRRARSGGRRDEIDEEDAAVDVSELLPEEGEASDEADGVENHIVEAAAAGGAEGSDRAPDPETDVTETSAGSPDRSRTVAEDVLDQPTVRSEDIAVDMVEPGSAGEQSPEVAAADEARGADDSGEAEPISASEDAPQAIGMVEDVGVTEVENGENGNGAEPEQVETVAAEDALEELPVRTRRRQRAYKIQEVTKRRQVILVQVVKEERGTKGAALTTYLSLAGRYTVLMPNTARGGGISRKITNAQDRKRLKAIAAELDVPEGMGLIIRTAGASRTKQEIRRDYEYLLRLWESVRELALSSNAPALVYEEGNLIKRAIRDLYGKDVEEIVVAGDSAHREAKDFMRMLMPSHAKNVIAYDNPEPLFSRYQIERQLNAMFSPYVHLRSGGYLVINQTEALVAIDINSGKSTREFSIEETALSTNLEAADEIARQLRLRDLAGLIVVDFIDMDEKRNNRAVERRMKDALRFDRARIQVGRISHFGLLEMSRQRMRTGVLEGSTTQCPHCQGTGIIRSTESVALAVLRGLEDALMSGQPASLVANTTATVALYILNNKRQFINEMESRYGITIQIATSDKVQGANFAIERMAHREAPQRRPERAAVNMDWGFEDEDEDGAGEGEEAVSTADADNGDGRRGRRRRRKRGRREEGGAMAHRGGGREQSDDRDEQPVETNGDDGYVHEPSRAQAADDDEPGRGTGHRDREGGRDDGESEDGGGRRGRRRGRRGGRRGQERGRPPLGPIAQGDQPAEGPNGWSGHAAEPHVADDALSVVAVAAFERDEVAAETSSAADRRERRADPRPALRPEWDDAQVEQALPPPVAAGEPAHRGWAPEVGAAQEIGTPAQPDRAPAYASSELETVVSEPEAPVEVPPPMRARSRGEPVSGEPVLERVVVGPGQVEAEPEETKPVRRGWWQRK
jgi:ribonuclease E